MLIGVDALDRLGYAFSVQPKQTKCEIKDKPMASVNMVCKQVQQENDSEWTEVKPKRKKFIIKNKRNQSRIRYQPTKMLQNRIQKVTFVSHDEEPSTSQSSEKNEESRMLKIRRLREQRVWLNKQNIEQRDILFDPSTKANLIHLQYLQRIGSPIVNLEPAIYHYKDRPISTLGKVKLSFKFGKVEHETVFLVTRQMIDDVILGYETLNKFGIQNFTRSETSTKWSQIAPGWSQSEFPPLVGGGEETAMPSPHSK